MPPASPYSGLEPGRWRSLLVRAAVFRAARAKIAEFSDRIDEGGDALLVLMELETRARGLLVEASDELDDDQLVDHIVRIWDERLGAALERPQLDSDLRQLLVEIRSLLTSACATDPFQEIFDRITAKARELYRDKWRPASLEMAHLGQPPRGGGDPYAVTAVTAWPQDKATASVELGIHDKGFRPATFAALQMVFAHECICHVPACQERPVNDSTFAEGLLDWVAYDLHEQWAVMLDSVLAPAARRHAETLRFFLTRDQSDEGSARRRGHRAAENLRAWFEKHDLAKYHIDGRVSSKDVAVINVIQLATELNVVERPLADKDNFVGLLGWPLPPEVERALEAWLAHEITADALLDVGGQGV